MSARPPEDAGSGAPEQVRLRRSPKILSFALAGALVGAILALILTLAFPPNDRYPASQVFGFLLLIGLTLGGALGAVVALILDRTLRRRAQLVEAVREVTSADREPDIPAPESPDTRRP